MYVQLREKAKSSAITHDDFFALQSVEKEAQKNDSSIFSSERTDLYKAEFKNRFSTDASIDPNTFAPRLEEIAQLRINITTTENESSSKLAPSPTSGSFDRKEVFFKTQDATSHRGDLKQYNRTQHN
jgi:hypothetical protein